MSQSHVILRIRSALDIMAAESGDLCIDCGLCCRSLRDFGGRISGRELDALVAAHAEECEVD